MKPQQLVALVALLVVASLGITIAPMVAPNHPLARKIAPRLGLDIQGGARVVLEADTDKLPKGQAWNEDSRAAVLRTIENRVNANGVAEPVITPKGDRQYVVEIPAVKNNREIVEQLQKTAQLEFYYSPDWLTQRNALGRYRIEPKVGESGRERYDIEDTTERVTFRDRFHINQSLREAMDRASRDEAKAVETPLPTPLESLPSAAGAASLKLLPEDSKTVSDLAQELQRFDAFLGASAKQMDGSDLQPGMAKAAFAPGGGGGLVS